MHGLHLTADLQGCRPIGPLMGDAVALAALCRNAVAQAGLRSVGELFHAFVEPGVAVSGVTGMVLLAESHLAVHTWPETGAVTLDVYVCNRAADNTARAEALLEVLLRAFVPGDVERHAIVRGRTPRQDGLPAGSATGAPADRPMTSPSHEAHH